MNPSRRSLFGFIFLPLLKLLYPAKVVEFQDVCPIGGYDCDDGCQVTRLKERVKRLEEFLGRQGEVIADLNEQIYYLEMTLDHQEEVIEQLDVEKAVLMSVVPPGFARAETSVETRLDSKLRRVITVIQELE